MQCIRQLMIVGLALVSSPLWAQTAAGDPKATMRSLYAAVAKADTAAIQRLLVVQNDPDQQLVKAYADLILAGKQLGDTARQRFPGAVGAFAQGTMLPEDSHLIDTAEATIDGNRATLKLSGRIERVQFERIDGVWRMVVAQAESTPALREQQRTLLVDMADAMRKSAQEISEERYNTIQDAEAAVKERLGGVLAKALRESTPSTRPTTAPAANGVTP